VRILWAPGSSPPRPFVSELAGRRLHVGARRTPREQSAKLHARLAAVSPVERHRTLAELTYWAGERRPLPPLQRALDHRELGELDRSTRITIGAHTSTHPRLAALPRAHQEREIGEGRSALQRRLGHPVSAFSYPFGLRSDFSAETSALVRAAGFEFALTAETGCLTRSTDPFALPRLWVRDWGAEEFARRLERWL
jgi:hypothetical protein